MSLTKFSILKHLTSIQKFIKQRDLSKWIFYLLIAVLPLNLGYHFEISGSYVFGKLIDYLVPTVYFQDLAALALVVALLFEHKKLSLKGPVKILFFFLIFLIPSIFVSPVKILSFSIYLRIFLYSVAGFFAYYYVDKKDFKIITKILLIQIIFVSLLAISQFVLQHSVFNNYLILGEQPYSSATPYITKESFFGHTVIPPMSLFRHPNALAGYLSVMLILIAFLFPKDKLSKLAFVLCLITLLLAFSYLTTIFLGVTLVLGYLNLDFKKIFLIYLLVISILFLLPFYGVSSSNPSIYRRANLLDTAYIVSGENLMLGVGTGAFTSVVDRFQTTSDIRFTQPVHNVFVLILTESGLLPFMLIVFLILYSSKLLIISKVKPFFLILMLTTLLMSSDHYFWTAQQPLLLLFLLLGFSWNFAAAALVSKHGSRQ